MECVHRRKSKLSNTSGHLYVFNKCIAFYSKDIKAIVLQYGRVKSIEKSSKLADRMKGKIKIYMDDQQKYEFKRIKHRGTLFDLLTKLHL